MILKKYIVLGIILLVAGFSGAEVIKNIRIVNQKGEVFDSSSVSAFTSYSIGQRVKSRDEILSAIATDVNRMRDSGRFSFVDARMDVETDGIVLVYTVTNKNKLRRLVIVGADEMKNGKVRKKSELEIGQFVDDAALAQAAAKIKEAYREFWYPDTNVKWEAKADDELGVVDVTFTIREGLKLSIIKVKFQGNETIDSKKLKKVIQQKQKHWFPFWSAITGSGKFHPEFEDMDVFAIKSLYMNSGFLDVRVEEPIFEQTGETRAHLVYPIVEGRQYIVDEISVIGCETFSNEELMRGIRMQRGDIAAYEAIEGATESIRAFYGNRGYIRTGVRPVLDADADKGVVDIRFEVSEGAVGYINKVNIRGNEVTKDEVIRRELIVYPGDKYNRSRVQTSENRLRNLQYFEVVTSNPDPIGEGDKYDLNVKVRERRTGQFSAGVGFSSVDSLVGYVELSQGNFDITTWPPVGGGQKFKIRAQLGTQRNDLDISFVEPWFLDRKLSFGVDLYHREARYFSDNYDQKTDGMRLSLGKPLSRFSRGSIGYTLELFDVFDVAPTASQSIREEDGLRLKSGLDFTLTRDTRDRFFNPTRGSKTTITPYFAGGPLGAETDIFGGRIRSSHFWPFFEDCVLNIRGQLETVDSFGNSKNSNRVGDGVPIFDRLFLGGSYTLRGFEYRDVGPFDGDDPVGGKSMGFITVEYTVPIWNQIRGATFYDAGFVNEEFMDFDTRDYNSNWGIGLRFDLPGFPLQLDYAWPIKANPRNDSSGRFNFLIGHSF